MPPQRSRTKQLCCSPASCQTGSASKSRSKTIIRSPPFSGLCGDPGPVLTSPILHLAFRKASPQGCHAARRSEDAARRL